MGHRPWSPVRGLFLALAVLAGSPADGEPQVIELAIRGGQLPGEHRVVRVPQGADVVLRWTSDAPVSVHLHGYDLEAKLAPGTPATMSFRARAAGRFPMTLHGAGRGEATLGYLEVHPR